MQRLISFRYVRPRISHPSGPSFATSASVVMDGRNDAGITRYETRIVLADRPPDQLASGHRLFVARPGALSALHGAGEQHRVAGLPGRLADLAVRYVPADHRSLQSQRF